MMKLLTFLGTSKNYEETTYILNEKQHCTKFCSVALINFFKPEKTLIVLTKAAKENDNYKNWCNEISKFTEIVAVDIPDGHSEDELWQIFQKITEKIQKGDELMVDITNGLRSLPFLSFLAVAFLRLALHVKVQKIYYGAFDAKDEYTNKTPVFDLTPFITLLDWTIATDRFTRFGDASDLAKLIDKHVDDTEATSAVHISMDKVSLALRMARPLEVILESKKLFDSLEEFSHIVEKEIPPFKLLTENIIDTYTPLSKLPEDKIKSYDKTYFKINLQIQFDLIERYIEQNHIIQATILAREWLVSLVIFIFHQENNTFLDYKVRKNIERNKLSSSINVTEDIFAIWEELRGIRNDIAHVGMRKEYKKANEIREIMEELYQSLKKLKEEYLA